MMDNSGNLNSPNNIASALDANRVPANYVTVGCYISYLSDAFVFYEAKRYDIKGNVSALGCSPGEKHPLHIIACTGVSAPRYDCGEGSSSIVYAEHEVVFLPSDQADRASGAWIDIPLHMSPLMRANEGYKGMTAQEALGVANGAEHRPAPALASGPLTGRYFEERE